MFDVTLEEKLQENEGYWGRDGDGKRRGMEPLFSPGKLSMLQLGFDFKMLTTK